MSVENTDLFDQWIKMSDGRFPSGYIDTRLLREQKKAASLQVSTRKQRVFNPSISAIINGALKLTGLDGIGRRNAERIGVRHNSLAIRNLPQQFNGYRILHISDLHFNDNTNFELNLLKAVDSVEYDLCVLTGDYRYRSFGSIEKSVTGLSKLKSVLNTDVLAIFGNHDSIVMTPHLEKLGIKVLINEQCELSLNDEHITFVGVDDPSYYQLDDVQRACGHAGFTESDCAILLAHSPDLYQQASDFGFGAYLCGHTHGGQLCLPGGYPVKSNTKAPRWAVSGEWHYNAMSGYTSAGAGTSIVEARFFCPPEITVHELTGASVKAD